MPASATRKSDLYNEAVTEAALQVIHEVVAKAIDPDFVPEPLDYSRADVWGRLRPSVRQADRSFSWSTSTEHIVRRIRAGDGTPGVHASLCGMPGGAVRRPSRVPALQRARRAGHGRAAPTRRGPGQHRRRRRLDRPPASACHDPHAGLKLPATAVLSGRLRGAMEASQNLPLSRDHLPPRRHGRHGELRLLQRRDVDVPVPTPAQCLEARHRPGHPSAAAAWRSTVRQRHPPGRDRGGDRSCDGGVGQHRRHRRRVSRDHRLHQSARGVLGGRQRRGRWGHARPGRRPGGAARRRRAQPALRAPWACTARSIGRTSCREGWAT